MRSLFSITADNFLSFKDAEVELKDLFVLVGPNDAGKSNLLRVIQFLGDTERLDLVPAIAAHGGASKKLRSEGLVASEKGELMLDNK